MPARPVPAKGAPPRPDALLGGRYRLLSPLGSGGTADVFRGVDQLLGREVAVKVFREGAQTVTADRFCDEARTLARLSHRALVTVYDAGRHGRGAFMVTELIRGVTLRTRMDAGPLSPVHVTRLGAELSSALDHVHAHGIIHHDVKPSNVLLREDGSPRLADFGLSRTVYDQPHGAPDVLVGTLAYMAPEQLLGRGAGTASDIYGLGVTLLEALTGHRARRGTAVEAATARLLHPPRIPEGLPGDLGRVLEAMTHRDPLARPDAAAVHLRLRDALTAPAPRAGTSAARTDSPTHRSPATPPTGSPAAEPSRRPAPARHRSPARRRRAALTGLAAVGAVSACALLMGGVRAGREAAGDSPLGHPPPASREAEGAGPRPTPPLPASPASTTGLPVTDPSAVPEPEASTGPVGSSSRPPGGERPAKAAEPTGTKEHPGQAKPKKDRGR
ncbi:protein kinase domain-containing protein [Streptomyces sp. NPDC054961]